MSRFISVHLLVFIIIAGCGDNGLHLWHDVKIGKDMPREVNVVIETPKGSKEKYEMDKKSGRIVATGIVNPGYLANYGFIPETYVGDGEPLDILVLSEPIETGSVLKVKIIGVLKMTGDKKYRNRPRVSPNYKIIGVPVDDEKLAQVRDIKDISENFKENLKTWSETYYARIDALEGNERAKHIIRQARAAYLNSEFVWGKVVKLTDDEKWWLHGWNTSIDKIGVDISELYGIDDKIAIAVGGSSGAAATFKSLMFRTHDGGKTWYKVGEEIMDSAFFDIIFYDEVTGWVMGFWTTEGGYPPVYIMRTDDSGKTWERNQFLDSGTRAPYYFNFKDKLHGEVRLIYWAMGPLGDMKQVYKTSDGGKTWTLAEEVPVEDGGAVKREEIKELKAEGRTIGDGTWKMEKSEGGYDIFRLRKGKEWEKVYIFPKSYVALMKQLQK